MSGKGLPFGRPPAQSPQNQFVDERRRSIVPQVEGWLSTVPPYTYDTTTSTTTANNLVLSLAPFNTYEVVVDTSRINCTTASASTSARSGIYVHEDAFFRLLPGTEALFDTTGTGVKDTSITRTVLAPYTRYYIGFVCTSATPAFSAMASRVFDRFSYSNITGTLPTTLLKSSATTSQSGFVGVVYYHSNLL